MPTRRRKLRGGSTAYTGNAINDVTGDNSAVSATIETGKNIGNTSIKNALNNPYTSQAVMLCAMVTLIPLTLYSFLGKSDSPLVQEIVMSCMAMALAASGITYFVLQDIQDKMFIYALGVIAAVSGTAWIYFAYKISQQTCDEDQTTS